MGVPTSEVGYTPAMPRREDHEVHKGHVVALEKKPIWGEVRILLKYNWCEKILSTPSFGGEVKPSVPCRRFAACKRSQNLCGSQNLGKIAGQISHPQFHLSLIGSLALLRTYRHLAAKVGTYKGGESNDKLPPRNCPGCSVPEPYRSHDWALIPANPASKAEY